MQKLYDVPEAIEKDDDEIKFIIAQIKASPLSDDVKTFIIKCVELALWLPVFLQRKTISIHRLRTMIFGKGYNKKDVNRRPAPNPSEANNAIDAAESGNQDSTHGNNNLNHSRTDD